MVADINIYHSSFITMLGKSDYTRVGAGRSFLSNISIQSQHLVVPYTMNACYPNTMTSSASMGRNPIMV